MSRILYLAELFKRIEWDPVLCSTPNNFDREYNIYFFDTSQNYTSYWVATWGGSFDTIDNTNVQILLGQFLLQVDTSVLLKATVNSFYVDGALVYINIPFKPWQYFKYMTEVLSSDGVSFSSAVKNSSNPSDIKYDGRKFFPKLQIPNLMSKLSDSISGLVLFPSFSYSIENNDGLLDDFEENNFHNTPTSIYKSSSVDNPVLSDFIRIRQGLVLNVSSDDTKFVVNLADYGRFFTNEICRTFSIDDFPNMSSSDIGKSIPVGFGPLNKLPLFEIDRDSSDPSEWIEYVAIEPVQVFSVTAVYDDNGNSITFTESGGVITVTELDDDGVVVPGKSVDLDGKQGYVVGSIVTELINDFSILKYLEGNWDIVETNNYISISDEVGFYFAGGELKKAVNELLKNDTAFIFTKNDGRYTIRRWGVVYDIFDIPSWKIVDSNKIKKDTSVQSKYYMSTAEVRYLRYEESDSYGARYRNTSKEIETFEKYRKSKIGFYDTMLTSEINAEGLTNRLLDRFTNNNEYISVDFTFDVSSVNFLDRINCEIQTNDRLYANFDGWIVRGVDPSQDRLILEPIPGTEVDKAILDDLEYAILDENELAIMGN